MKSHKYFYMWCFLLSMLSYFSQIIGNFIYYIISVFIICFMIILFYKARKNDYISIFSTNYRLKLVFDIIIIVIVSIYVFIFDAFVIDNKEELYLIHLLAIPFLLPIIVNSAKMIYKTNQIHRDKTANTGDNTGDGSVS